MLEAVPELKKYIYVIEDEYKKKLVQEIIKLFEETVLKFKCQLTAGVIHGDFNEQNILVNKNEAGEWMVTSILDFGDTSYSCYLFELAIVMTYTMILNKNIDSGGYVYAGFSSELVLPDNEIKLLKVNLLRYSKYCIVY